MYQIIIVIHVLLGVGIIGLVLMQQGRGADAGAAFGSGASGSVFGAQGTASFLSRTTAIFATLFFITSLSLAFLSGKTGKVVDIMQSTTVEKTSVDLPAADGATAPPVITEPVANATDVPVVASEIAKPVESAPATPETQPGK